MCTSPLRQGRRGAARGAAPDRALLVLALLVLTLLVLNPSTLPAADLNGFFPAPGETQLALSYSTESWDEFWRGSEKVSTPPALGKADIMSLSLWMRHGISERLALVGTLPYVDAEADGTAGFDESSLQDLTLLAKYRLAVLERARGVRHVFAVAGGIRTPASDYEANLPLDVGDGTTDTLFRFVYQLEQGRFFLSQEVGFDLRSEDAPDGFPVYTEVGFRTGRVSWIGSFSSLWADGGTDIGDPGFTFPSNQEEYQRVGAKLYARLGERFGVSAGGFTTLDGRNSGDATGFSAGLVARF